MFTGIVTDIGELTGISGSSDKRLVIRTNHAVSSIGVGSSIACAGICLTVTETGGDWFKVLASKETITKTTIAAWKVGNFIIWNGHCG